MKNEMKGSLSDTGFRQFLSEGLIKSSRDSMINPSSIDLIATWQRQ